MKDEEHLSTSTLDALKEFVKHKRRYEGDERRNAERRQGSRRDEPTFTLSQVIKIVLAVFAFGLAAGGLQYQIIGNSDAIEENEETDKAQWREIGDINKRLK